MYQQCSSKYWLLLQIPQSLRIILETSDLTYAAPSTISRCGVIRISDNVVPIDSLHASWVKKSHFPPDLRPAIDNFVQHVVKAAITFVQSSANCILQMKPSYLFLVNSNQCITEKQIIKAWV